MSGKIRSKDLNYDKSLPPFLQRLHAQRAGNGDADRHEREIARPKKAKASDDDDGPTVVDERGETLDKDAVESMTRSSSSTDDVPAVSDTPVVSTAPAHNKSSKAVEQKLTTGAAPKKRKAAVVGGKDDGVPDQEGTESVQPAKKSKKKSKSIKLTFDDYDDNDGQ
nr:hypothetical protein CFP56_68808 [Quercus suber]